MPADLFESNDWRASTQLVVDGYEQLGWLSRWRLKRHCRRHACGLLATTHVDVGLPTIFVTEPTPELAQQLVVQLLELHGNADLCRNEPYTAAHIAGLLSKHNGNLREVLFELYDLYESARATVA